MSSVRDQGIDNLRDLESRLIDCADLVAGRRCGMACDRALFHASRGSGADRSAFTLERTAHRHGGRQRQGQGQPALTGQISSAVGCHRSVFPVP